MLRGLGSWLGLDNQTLKTSDEAEERSTEREEKVVEAQNEVNKQPSAGEPEPNPDNCEQDKGLGGEHQHFQSHISL